MARDNGQRGSYRHVSPTKDNDDGHKHEAPLSSPPESTTTTTATTQTTSPQRADEIYRPASHDLFELAPDLFDFAPESLNARFPVMSIPGSLSSPSLPAAESPARVRATWADVAIANIFYGSAALGFMVIMYDGVGAIGGLAWGLVCAFCASLGL